MKQVTLQPVQITANQQTAKKDGAKDAINEFSEMLDKAVDTVNERKMKADALAKGLVAGQHANIHETMIAIEQAGISFRLMTKVQQKVIDAYREIMRMQV
jgi:flagellar hook-basal body complex protein FliE